MSDSSKVTVNYFCVGALLIFVGCVLICSLGFTIVLPYELTKNWPEVKCRVLNSSYNPYMCSCEEGYGGLEQYYGSGWVYNLMTLKVKQNSEGFNNSESAFERHDANSISESLFHHPTCSSKFPCLQILVEYRLPQVNVDEALNVSHTNFNSRTSFNSTFSASDISTAKIQETKSLLRRSYDDLTIFGRPLSYRNRRHLIHLERRSKIIRSLDVYGAKQADNEESTTTTYEHFSTTSQISTVKMGIAYLFRSWDDSFHSRCSLIECGDEIWNIKENIKFRKEWGVPGKVFTCFYNPKNHTVAIKEKTSPVVVMHAILWPILSLLVGAIIWICLCCGFCKSGKDSSCKEKYKLVS